MGRLTAQVPAQIHLYDRSYLKTSGYFFVGGRYVEADDQVEGISSAGINHILRGQMYVEVYVPQKVTHKYPMVFFPGNNQTALCWMVTPDGREGWASHFLREGYIVYLADPPYRGRSACLLKEGEKEFQFSAERCEKLYAGKGDPAYLQWPGEANHGTPEFDAFYATVAPSLVDNRQMQIDSQIAGAELLDKIGPAIVAVHSQSGPFGWLIADARPDKVKALVMLEPKGPPFVREPTRPWEYAVWGLTEIPMKYDPPAECPEDIPLCPVCSDRPGMRSGFLQKEPARKLKNLTDIPMLLISGSVSYHSKYDYLTVRFLEQAGAKRLTHLELEKLGEMGNSHMMMLEKNSLRIADLVSQWLLEQEL